MKSNPRAIGFLAVSLALLTISVAHLLNHQDALVQAMNEVFAY